MSNKDKEIYEFGDFRLDVPERRIGRLGADERDAGALPEKAFLTLVHLVRNGGRLVTKDELIEAVWPGTFVEENNLDKAVHSIRQHLGEKPGERKYIETVRKHGYRFVAPVTRTGQAEAVQPDADDGGARGRESTAVTDRARARRVTAVIAAAGLVAVMGAAVWHASVGGRPAATNAAPANRAAGPSAYDLYVRGKVKVASENPEETSEAIALLERAVEADPNLAKAHAALARGYNTMAFKYSSGAESKRWHENAEVAIEKALELDPDLAEAHFARGLILWSNTEGFPHERAIQSYKRSLEIDPDDDETHHQLSFVYSHIGLLDEARGEVDRALEINPNNTLARYRTGVYAQYQGRFEDALAVHKTVPRDFTPLLVERTMAELLIQTGRPGEAERIVDDYLRKFPQDEGGSFTSVKALLLAVGGKRTEAEEMIRRAEEIGSDFGHFHHTAYNIASAYAAMREPEAAVRWLERTADGGFPNYPYFQIDPNLESIRSDPKFIEFMERLRTRWERFKAIV